MGTVCVCGNDRQQTQDAIANSQHSTVNIEEIQKYLSKYGYYTGQIDNKLNEETKNAIKMCQKILNMEQNCKCDAAFRNELAMTKRCGVKDTNMFNESKSKSEMKIERNEEYYAKKLITYAIGEFPDYLAEIEVKQCVQNAFYEWDRHCGLSFEMVENMNECDIKIVWSNLGHGMGISVDGPGGTLGIAIVGMLELDMSENWIIVNEENKHSLSVIKDKTTWNKELEKPNVSLINVLLHEIGHTLGLSHSENKCDLMYPIYNPNINCLSHGDIKRIVASYHANQT
eukprot:221010_1